MRIHEEFWQGGTKVEREDTLPDHISSVAFREWVNSGPVPFHVSEPKAAIMLGELWTTGRTHHSWSTYMVVQTDDGSGNNPQHPSWEA